MPSPTLTPSLLSTLGPSASAPAALLAAQQARESQPGAFARELQKMQTQAPVVSPPPPPQPKPPTQPPTLPPARPTDGSATGSATGPTSQATGSGSGTGSSGSRDSVAATKPDTAGSDGPAKPSEPTLDRQRQRLRSGRSDEDGSGARVRTIRTVRSDAGADGQTARPDRADPSERAARRRSSDLDPAADPSATAATQPAPALPTAGQPLPARSALQAGADPAFVGPQPDARLAGNEPDAPRVPGIDLLNGRVETLAAGTAARAEAAQGTPRPPQRPATAGDTVPSLAADGVAGPGARTAAQGPSADMQVAIAGRQDDASSALQAATTGPQPALPSFAAELARASGTSATSPAAAPPAAAPPPAELTLPTPVTAPDFLPRLGGELAVLARDGVQEARINVHPVELGPISVQIALDGTAAQVHLAVDNAQTRELLEQAMPTLAAALRDTGLTLTGGGVFQQSRQSQQEQAATDKRNAGLGRLSGDDGDSDLNRLAAATPRRLRPLGALDVFA